MGELMSVFMKECRFGRVMPLVIEFVRVPIEPQLWGHYGLVEMVALVAALARLDEHHGPAEAFAVRAGKGHVSCAGATWRAAAAVPAYSTVVGPIEASAPTASIWQTMWLWGLMGARALPSFLWTEKEERSNSVFPVKRLHQVSTAMHAGLWGCTVHHPDLACHKGNVFQWKVNELMLMALT